MRQLNLILAAGLALGVCGCSTMKQTSRTRDNQQARSFEREVTRTLHADYLLFLPQGYDDKAARRWPLIFFLHGAGERGTNIWLVAKHGPPKIVKDKPGFPFIVVSPQCPAGEHWSNDVLLALLDEVTRKYKVDTGRIYLTGLSMGGYGAWALGVAYPEKFAAVAPICGGGDPVVFKLHGAARAGALKNLPIWAFHGAKDPTVPLEESERMVNALKKFGYDAKLTVYPEAGHDSWTATYDNPALYDWFLQQERKAAPGK